MKIVLSLSTYLTNRVLLMLLMNHCCVKFESLNMFEVQWSMLCTSCWFVITDPHIASYFWKTNQSKYENKMHHVTVKYSKY